ncbi:hypothetical protein BDQ12DRAFT_669799 [Crucibulum laeve]|uniref:Uncharacterized protein n=1 Tax=Crucibulum laeve TaxID=68775 RepID=A0A5C3LMH2_9AGAR|nr:hypothetical protein BDQ12DRAFT_669799 [Crucibulum laeve]
MYKYVKACCLSERNWYTLAVKQKKLLRNDMFLNVGQYITKWRIKNGKSFANLDICRKPRLSAASETQLLTLIPLENDTFIRLSLAWVKCSGTRTFAGDLPISSTPMSASINPYNGCDDFYSAYHKHAEHEEAPDLFEQKSSGLESRSQESVDGKGRDSMVIVKYELGVLKDNVGKYGRYKDDAS